MATGADKVAAKLAEMAARMQNLQPALEVFGAWLVKSASDSFRAEKEHDGSQFVPLSVGTIDARLRKAGALKTVKRGAAKGYLTASAAKKQERMTAPGGIKILTDTARARNSQNYKASAQSLTYSVVGYLGAHMAGTADIPKRNPTAFEKAGAGWALGERGSTKLREVIASYVRTGKAKV
jgi:hypothetical protein